MAKIRSRSSTKRVTRDVLTLPIIEKVKALRADGATVPEIMRRTKLSNASIYRALGGVTQERLTGCVECNKWGRLGDTNRVLELKEDDLAAVRERPRT
jgi:hypothetical protein